MASRIGRGGCGALGNDPTSGDLFVFRNRRGGSLKILAWMGDGFALYLRQLEQGTFAFPTASTPVRPNKINTLRS
jgi:transposase